MQTFSIQNNVYIPVVKFLPYTLSYNPWESDQNFTNKRIKSESLCFFSKNMASENQMATIHLQNIKTQSRREKNDRKNALLTVKI